jgi:hypothetical protein
MNDTRKRRFERNARVVAFCDERTTDFPENSARGKSATNMKSIHAELERLDTERTTNTRLKQQGTSGKQSEREALRKLITAISDTADTISLDYPEIKDAFRRPKANSNDQTLLSTARSFAEAARPYKNRFTEYDMAADFFDKLDARITSFEQAIKRQEHGTSANASANAALEDAFRRGDQELARLDTFIRNKYGDDPATMAAWERARRIERPRHTKKAAAKGSGNTTGSGNQANP